MSEALNRFASERLNASFGPVQSSLGAYFQNLSLEGIAFDAGAWPRTTTMLEAAFRRQSGTDLDSLGELRSVLGHDDDASRALDLAVSSVGTAGPLGVDFTAVRDRTEQLSVQIDRLDRDVRRALDAALDAAGDARHTNTDAAREHAGLLGLQEFGRQHRRSVGIILAYTSGLGWLVCDLAEGHRLVPTTVIAAFVLGSQAYDWVIKRLGDDETGSSSKRR
ncbi:hypothetical protein [Curtobacterium sp. RRHDQ10]|uniref:hypothetical protein n=1 Tax=Curtobacterium phyllosphaerae TaxID=3413379 RepID=UPI003BEF5DD6